MKNKLLRWLKTFYFFALARKQIFRPPEYQMVRPLGKLNKIHWSHCREELRLVPSSVGRALGSHYAKYATRITLFSQGKIAIIRVHKEIQMSIYSGKDGLTCLLSHVVKKGGVHGCISW